jgi:hypothetical protein
MIPQINIVVNNENEIKGFNNVNIKDLEQITNGYVNNIVFTCIDEIEQDQRDRIFVSLLKKLSHGGSLTIKFLNPYAIAHKIKSGSMDGSGFASSIKNIKSSWTEPDFLSIAASGQGYRLIKFHNEDLYSIAVIEKNK